MKKFHPLTLLGVIGLVEAALLNGSCYNDPDPLNPVLVVPAPIAENVTTDTCILECGAGKYSYAAIGATNAEIICFCGSLEVEPILQLAADNSSCSQPGASDGFYSVYASGSVLLTSLNATVAATGPNGRTAVVTALANIGTAVFQYDFGDGRGFGASNVNTYSVPGTFAITVKAIQETTGISLSQVLKFAWNAPSEVVVVDCPPVVEYNASYGCAIAVLGYNFTVETSFSTGTSFNLNGIDTVWSSYGNVPPKDNTTVSLSAIPATDFTLTDAVVRRLSFTSSIEYWANQTGTFILQFSRTVCSTGSLCPLDGLCHRQGECPSLDKTECSSTQFFKYNSCPEALFAGFCSSNVNEECPAPLTGTTPTYVPYISVPVTINNVGYNFYDLKDLNIWLEPGLVVTGSCSTQGCLGTLENSATAVLQLTAAEIPAISFNNTCSDTSNPIVFTVDTGTGTVFQNSTKCQVPVILNWISITPNVTIDTNTIAIESSVPETVSFDLVQGEPWTYTILRGEGTNITKDMLSTLRAVDSFAYNTAGIYTLNTSVYNDLTLLRANFSNINNTKILKVIVQDPVLPSWSFQTGLIDFFSGSPATLNLVRNAPYPTNATIAINWGDGSTTQLVNLDSSGGSTVSTYPLTYTYGIHGYYQVQAQIYNFISSQNTSLKIMILRGITGLNGVLKYRTVSGAWGSGFGSSHSMFPANYTIRFNLAVADGTVEYFELRDVDTGTLLQQINVTNPFNPVGYFYDHIFTEEGSYNISLSAYNDLQPNGVTVYLPFNITGELNGLDISDLFIVTSPNETKLFQISLLSLGAGTCLAVDFGDGSALISFGEAPSCLTYYPKAKFNDSLVVDTTVNITHEYTKVGAYNVTAYARDSVTDLSRLLPITVTNLKNCKPPLVYVLPNSTDFRNPMTVNRSDGLTLTGRGLINCSLTLSTKKEWSIVQLNESSQKVLATIPIRNILSSWNYSVLSVPAGFLPVGLYEISYFLTMSDPSVLDPSLLLTRLASTYVRVSPSNLQPAIIQNSVTIITRGPGQFVEVAADQWSIDPDDPKNKNFSYRWYCHRLSPVPETVVETNGNQTMIKNSVDNGGCFGYGPGYLAIVNGSFRIPADSFIAVNNNYRITLLLSKDVRNSGSFLDLYITDTPVPIVSVKCQNPLLCQPADGVLYVNRNNRLALISSCTSNCSSNSVFDWYLEAYINGDFTPVPLSSYASGLSTSEISISSSFFDDFKDLETFRIGLSVTSPNFKAPGSAEYVVYVNKPPVNGTCSVSRTSFYALVDTATVTCQQWIDPESIGIQSYTYYVLPVTANSTLTGQQTLRSSNIPIPASIILPAGDFNLFVNITDMWNGVTTYSVGTLKAMMPSQQQYNDFLASKALQLAAGSGDPELLMMSVNALMAVQSSAPWSPLKIDNTKNLTESEDAILAATAQKLAALQLLQQNVPFDSVAMLESGSSALASILRGTSVEGTSSLTLSSTLRDTAMSIIKKMNGSIDAIPVATPTQLLPLVTNLVDAMGSFVTGVTNILSTNDPYHVPPADVRSAGTWFYDTDLGDDPFMEVSADPDLQLRGNVLDTTKTGSAGQISQLMDIALNLHKKMLSMMVTGESYQSSSPDGIVFTSKMVSIEDMRNATFTYGNSGASITFPPNFCPYPTTTTTTSTTTTTTTTITSPTTSTKATTLIPTRGTSTASAGTTSTIAALASTQSTVSPFTTTIGNSPLNSALTCANKTFGVASTVWPVLTRSAVPTAALLSPDTYVIDVDIMDRNLSLLDVQNLDPPVTLKIPRNPIRVIPGPTAVNTTQALGLWPIPIAYSMFNLTTPGVTLHVEITPGAPDQTLVLLISREAMPTLQKADHTILVPSLPKINNTFIYSLPTTGLSNSTGRYFVGILQVKIPSYPAVPLTAISQSSSRNPLGSLTWINLTSDYNLKISSSGCYYFDPKSKAWSTEGLSVASGDSSLTTCYSTHLSSFGSGFFVPPNTIDFAYVFAHASFTDNITIYLTIIVTLTVYLLLLIWSSIQDRKDQQQLEVTPLPDNRPGDKYLYEILVFTADKADADTDSQVQFIVSGDEDDSGVRTLDDPRRKLFRKGATDYFVMAVPRRLGNLTYLRIWHDSSGEGRNASWFLNYIVIRDVQTGEKFVFIADCWFALEEVDGKIDRLLPVAGKEQITEFRHLFATTSSNKLRDGHLWFSVFLRSPRSRFTRVERLSSCVALLYLSMLVNAMWYGKLTGDNAPTKTFSLGPIKLSTEQIGVGFMSDLIVFPPSFLIVLFFRKSRPRHWRPSRILQAMGANHLSGSQVRPHPRKRPFLLPWWCRYIAWLLVVVSMGVSVFFLWAYGIQFGEEKTNKWLTSLVISFFTSVLFVQPFKVLLTALFMSVVCRPMETDVDDADIDEEDPVTLVDDEHAGQPKRNRASKSQPVLHAYDRAYLEKLRAVRLKEVKMWQIVRNAVSYLIFAGALLIICYYNRDPKSFLQRDNIEKTFVTGPKFDKITTQNDLWTWVQQGLIPNLQAHFWYNGQSPYGQRGYISDRVNRILGYATMRQIRIKADTCKVPVIMSNISHHCSAFTDMIDEDTDDYCSFWTKSTSLNSGPFNCSYPEFQYTKSSTLQELPLVGKLSIYTGGGYVIRLRGSQSLLMDTVKTAAVSNWIDSKTRAVIIYFSVYNVQVNLFSLVTLMAEFSPSGNIVPSWDIDVIRLVTDYSDTSVIVPVALAVYLIFILYFTYRELRLICKEGKEYFRRYWSFVELAIIVLSYVAVGIFVVRYFITQKFVNVFVATWGNGYVNMRYASLMDFAFSYCLAAIAFLTILKFLQLIDYDPRVQMLSEALRLCAPGLFGFTMVILAVLVPFALIFCILVGANVESYSSIPSGLISVFCMMMKMYDFEALRDNSRMAPVMFVIFSTLSMNILMNLFTTLIMSVFEMLHNREKHRGQMEIVEYIVQRVKEAIDKGKSGLWNKSNKIHPKPAKTKNRIRELPWKIDRLIDSINSVYFKGEHNEHANQAAKKRY